MFSHLPQALRHLVVDLYNGVPLDESNPDRISLIEELNNMPLHNLQIIQSALSQQILEDVQAALAYAEKQALIDELITTAEGLG